MFKLKKALIKLIFFLNFKEKYYPVSDLILNPLQLHQFLYNVSNFYNFFILSRIRDNSVVASLNKSQ